MQTAYFAGGCFWGMQSLFDDVPGVLETRVGYMGGALMNPTYEAVCSDTTGHAETVEIVFDPDVISYEALLDLFFEHHDPTTLNRQGPDVGTQYRSAIFYTNEAQRRLALRVIQEKMNSKQFQRPITTQVIEAPRFFPAEEYHQHYWAKRGKIGCLLSRKN